MGNTRGSILVLLLSVTWLGALSQVQASDVQIWVDVTDFFDLTENSQFGGTIGYKEATQCDLRRSFFVRPTINYQLNTTFSIWGGVALTQNWEPLKTFETRPWVGLFIKYPKFSRVSFSHIIRLEERLFDFGISSSRLEIGRFRYRFKAVVPLDHADTETAKWYLPVYFEIATRTWGDLPTGFVHMGRLSLGVGYRIKEDWRLEVTYHQEQRKLTQTGKFRIDEHVVRVQIKGW